jgi:hypothetical protein
MPLSASCLDFDAFQVSATATGSGGGATATTTTTVTTGDGGSTSEGAGGTASVGGGGGQGGAPALVPCGGVVDDFQDIDLTTTTTWSHTLVQRVGTGNDHGIRAAKGPDDWAAGMSLLTPADMTACFVSIELEAVGGANHYVQFLVANQSMSLWVEESSTIRGSWTATVGLIDASTAWTLSQVASEAIAAPKGMRMRIAADIRFDVETENGWQPLSYVAPRPSWIAPAIVGFGIFAEAGEADFDDFNAAQP